MVVKNLGVDPESKYWVVVPAKPQINILCEDRHLSDHFIINTNQWLFREEVRKAADITRKELGEVRSDFFLPGFKKKYPLLAIFFNHE